MKTKKNGWTNGWLYYLVVQVSTTTQPWWRRLWLARKFAILSKETSSSAKEWVSWLPNPSRIWKQSNFFVKSKHKRLSNSYGSDLSFFYSSAKSWGPKKLLEKALYHGYNFVYFYIHWTNNNIFEKWYY